MGNKSSTKDKGGGASPKQTSNSASANGGDNPFKQNKPEAPVAPSRAETSTIPGTNIKDDFFECAETVRNNIQSACSQIEDRDRGRNQGIAARAALRKIMRVVDEGLEALKKQYADLPKKNVRQPKWKEFIDRRKQALDQLSSERDEMVASFEGRLEEHRRDQERRRGGFDNLRTIAEPAGRGGEMTIEEQMKMEEIRRKEGQQDEILNQINDNLEHLNWKAKQLSHAIEDSSDIVDNVITKSAGVDGRVARLREDVQEANEKTKKKKKKKNVNISKAKMAAHAAGALIS